MIGVIDKGIDYNHAAFRNADGTTRIKKVIDFSKNNIKQVYDTEEAIMALTTDATSDSHGTHVAAIAGGSDLGNGLKDILGTTDIESISMDGHREATPSTMYSVDAPVYNMMGQRVNKSQKGLVIYKGRKYVNK